MIALSILCGGAFGFSVLWRGNKSTTRVDVLVLVLFKSFEQYGYLFARYICVIFRKFDLNTTFPGSSIARRSFFSLIFFRYLVFLLSLFSLDWF